jgi:DUF971 family protein
MIGALYSKSTAGLRGNVLENSMNAVPVELRLRSVSKVLEVSFTEAERYALPFEYLRVNSPSAEVQGHGPGQAVLVLGKEQVQITAVEPVGNYAVRLVFDDGHDSGLYTWKYLRELGREMQQKTQEYRRRVEGRRAEGVAESAAEKNKAEQ